MEKVENHLRLNESSKRTEIDTRKGDALWELFAGIFGSKLTSQYGDECPIAWHRILVDLTHEEIGRGVRWLRNEGREWPPAATEFWKLCKKQEAPRPGQAMKMLPITEQEWEKRKEKAAKEIAKMRIKLNTQGG